MLRGTLTFEVGVRETVLVSGFLVSDRTQDKVIKELTETYFVIINFQVVKNYNRIF